VCYRTGQDQTVALAMVDRFERCAAEVVPYHRIGYQVALEEFDREIESRCEGNLRR
jgi:hypothetical protein